MRLAVFKRHSFVRAARAALRFRACACEGSEAWRADTLCCELRKNPHVLLNEQSGRITLIHRRDYRASARKEASDLVAPLRPIYNLKSVGSPGAAPSKEWLIKRAGTEPSAQS